MRKQEKGGKENEEKRKGGKKEKVGGSQGGRMEEVYSSYLSHDRMNEWI